MQELLFYYALVTAVLLTVGETLILLKTDKYWPLSLDDYAVCVGLTVGAWQLSTVTGALIMLISWSFMLGNLYAMLFTRLDPAGGSRERLKLLTLLLVAGLVGLALSLNQLFQLYSAA